LGGFGGLADRLNQYNHYLGDPGSLARDLARYDEVTPEALRRFASESLTRHSRLLVLGLPGEKVVEDVPRSSEVAEQTSAPHAAPAAPSAEWRNKPPAAGPPSALALPVPERFMLPNGLSVYLLQQHRLPVVAVSLVVLSGSETNPLDKPGLAAFTAAMLQEGTAARSSQQIADDAAQI